MKNSNILLSVVVPIHNTGKYLERCLESLKNQYHQNIEVICVDDGSSDNSFAIIKKYCQADNRFKIFQHVLPKGVSAARNSGINIASGKYIHFCDSDDYVQPEIYIKAIDTLETFKTKSVIMNILSWNPDELEKGVHNYYYFKRDKIFPYKIFNVFDDKTKKLNSCPEVWDKVFELRTIKKNNISFQKGKIYEDLIFNWMFFLHEPETIFIGDYLYCHQYGHTGSIMTQTETGSWNKFSDALCVYSNVKKYIFKHKLYEPFGNLSNLKAYLRELKLYSLMTYMHWRDNYINYQNKKGISTYIIEIFLFIRYFFWKIFS